MHKLLLASVNLQLRGDPRSRLPFQDIRMKGGMERFQRRGKTPKVWVQDLESGTTVAVRKFAQRYVVVFFTEGKDTRIVTVYHASDVGSLISRKLRRGAWVEKK